MSNLIRREDAIKAVEQEYKIDRGYMADDYTYGFNQAIQYVSDIILQDLPSAEAVQGWIPVSERLPDAEYGEGDSVLCCTELSLMYILYWNGGNWCVPTGEPYQWINYETGWHDKVIAWMPLPEPYRGDGE